MELPPLYLPLHFAPVQVSYEVVEVPPPSLRPLRAGAATSTSLDVKLSGVLGQCMANASSVRTATEREAAAAAFPFKEVRREMEGYMHDWRIQQNSGQHGALPTSRNWWANPHMYDNWMYREDNEEFMEQWPDLKCALTATLTTTLAATLLPPSLPPLTVVACLAPTPTSSNPANPLASLSLPTLSPSP